MLTDVKAQKVGEEQFSRDDWDLVSLTVSKDTVDMACRENPGEKERLLRSDLEVMPIIHAWQVKAGGGGHQGQPLYIMNLRPV